MNKLATLLTILGALAATTPASAQVYWGDMGYYGDYGIGNYGAGSYGYGYNGYDWNDNTYYGWDDEMSGWGGYDGYEAYTPATRYNYGYDDGSYGFDRYGRGYDTGDYNTWGWGDYSDF